MKHMDRCLWSLHNHLQIMVKTSKWPYNFWFLKFCPYLLKCYIFAWPLTLKFLAMTNTSPVFLIEKSSYLVYLNKVVAPNCISAHIWSCGDLDIQPLDIKFSEILNISLFNWRKFLSDISQLSSNSKTVFFPIFGHVVTWTFDLWASNFQKHFTLPQ